MQQIELWRDCAPTRAATIYMLRACVNRHEFFAAQTLCCGNTVSDHLVQVAGADVRLVDATTRQLLHQWRPPAGLQINVASVNPTQVRLCSPLQ